MCVRTMRVFQSYTLRLSIAILNSPSWKPSIASHPVELPREPASRQAGRHSARVAGRQTRAQDGASGLARTVGRIEEVRVVGDLEVFAGGDDGPDHVIHAHQRAPAVLEDPSDDARLGRGYPADVQCWGQACHQLQPRRAARYEAGGWGSRGAANLFLTCLRSRCCRGGRRATQPSSSTRRGGARSAATSLPNGQHTTGQG